METAAETKNFFIYYKPKDIVSGDFYHALAHKHDGSNTELFYVCTADCTGHGVPGALMSMMGISHLNESIIEKKLVLPNEILDNMRKGIIGSLNPEGSEEVSRDGMDCVLCAYDFQNMVLEFAGAYNPLWLLRDKKIIEYKGDKMPVGKMDEENRAFTLQRINLRKGDIVYTFTDGFADQFGGPKGKKFKYKQLEELLISISDQPMEKQEQLLDRKFTEWRDKLEQVDDVTVIGIKI